MIDWVSAFGILMQYVERNEFEKANCVNVFCVTIEKCGFKYQSKTSLLRSYNFFALFYSDQIDCRINIST